MSLNINACLHTIFLHYHHQLTPPEVNLPNFQGLDCPVLVGHYSPHSEQPTILYCCVCVPPKPPSASGVPGEVTTRFGFHGLM